MNNNGSLVIAYNVAPYERFGPLPDTNTLTEKYGTAIAAQLVNMYSALHTAANENTGKNLGGNWRNPEAVESAFNAFSKLDPKVLISEQKNLQRSLESLVALGIPTGQTGRILNSK